MHITKATNCVIKECQRLGISRDQAVRLVQNDVEALNDLVADELQAARALPQNNPARRQLFPDENAGTATSTLLPQNTFCVIMYT